MKQLSFIFTYILTMVFAYGQETASYTIPSVLPASPTVAGLMNFEEVPVDNYTGIPSIGVPLFTVPLDQNLSLNLNASYHTEGIKVSNRSGWLGNGWSLTGLGTISRTVVGKPDEQLAGILSQHQAPVNGGYSVSYYDYDTMDVDEKNDICSICPNKNK